MMFSDGFAAQLGIDVISSTKDRVEVAMPITEDILQPFGVVHGGATISLLETAASIGAEQNADITKERPFGVEVNIRHHKSGGKRGVIRGVAQLTDRACNKQFWAVVAYDDEGDVLSDGIIMTKIVSLERIAEKAREREAAKLAKKNNKQ